MRMKGLLVIVIVFTATANDSDHVGIDAFW
jgi:hypothetical protein